MIPKNQQNIESDHFEKRCFTRWKFRGKERGFVSSQNDFFFFTYLINEFCLNLNTLQNELKWIIRLNEIRSYKNIISVTFVPKARIQIFLLEFSEKISQSLRLFWLEGRQPLKFIALFTQYHLSFFPMWSYQTMTFLLKNTIFGQNLGWKRVITIR